METKNNHIVLSHTDTNYSTNKMSRSKNLKQQAVWIDLDNSPHVPLFLPIIKKYRDQNREVILTARNHSQTIELLQNAKMDGTFTVVGSHFGKSKLNKIAGLLARTRDLVNHIQSFQKSGTKVCVAISHGSRSMVLAAKWLKIPVITMYDYEFTETIIFNRLSNRVMIPDKIPNETLDRIGLKHQKRVKYDGYKEELYLNYYETNSDFWKKVENENGITIDQSKVIVVLRPPATTANYHNEKSDEILDALIKKLLSEKNVFTIILPRIAEQKFQIEKSIVRMKFSSENYLIPKRAINGLDLAFHSDLLISGGGTMNREAALLGVPVYSIFAGTQGALDAEMEKTKMISFIRTTEEIKKISLNKRTISSTTYKISDKVERRVFEELERFMN